MENKDEEQKDQNKDEEQKDTENTHSIMDSINFVVDMMNSGKLNPKDVYPPGRNRYHGD